MKNVPEEFFTNCETHVDELQKQFWSGALEGKYQMDQ